MTKLFQRAARLSCGGRDVSALHFEFRCERDAFRVQNTAEIRVYGLSQDTRRFLQEQKAGAFVDLRAGYVEQNPLPLVMRGQLRIVTSLRDGADWITEISTGDADVARTQPISFSLGPGTTFENAVKRIVSDLRAGAGNMAQALKGKAKSFPNGITVHGAGDDELAAILRGEGLEHSWQDNEVQIVPTDGGALQGEAVLLNAQTGLVGSPEIGLKMFIKNLKARSLLNTEIRPGRVVQVESANVSGTYVVYKVSHVGQIAGNDYFTDLEARERK